LALHGQFILQKSSLDKLNAGYRITNWIRTVIEIAKAAAFWHTKAE
jgi:hypothetical protein